MCGIAFLYNPESSKPDSIQMVKKSMRLMHHRGPDDSGIIEKAGAVLAHQRLAIIDLSGSKQPIEDPAGRFTLVFNGEIYNYKRLRNELQNRWSFRTHGDTEVVLAGLCLFGASFISRLEGMFAILLWDAQEKSVLAARDRLGKKPLYYCAETNRFTGASELPVLRQIQESGFAEDMDSTADYLRHGYYLPGTTAYVGVKEILPGHWLKWKEGFSTETGVYWSIPLGNFSGTRESASVELKEAMCKAVERRMVSDVEVGAFLSGGVDSSLIVALMKSHCGITPKTFSIGFTEKSHDERFYARKVSQQFNTDHYEDVLKLWDTEQLRNLILNHVGQPFADSSILPTAKVAELASRHVKVALSGDGGDELFGGYQRYKIRAFLRWYTRLPLSVRKSIKKSIQNTQRFLPISQGKLPRFFLTALDILSRTDDETPYTAPVNYTNSVFSELVPEIAGRGHTVQSIPAEARLDEVRAMLLSDALIYLPQDILLKVDRATMAHSLEARAPFLDTSVVELAFSMPIDWHIKRGKGKKILFDTFSNLLPDEIWHRKKKGFAVPLHEWFRTGLEKELLNMLESKQTPISKAVVERLVNEHKSRNYKHGYKLWNIYVYLLNFG